MVYWGFFPSFFSLKDDAFEQNLIQSKYSLFATQFSDQDF